MFSNLIDEKLQIQEAKAAKIEIDEKLVDDQFARLAARFKQSPEQFSKYLTSKGSSAGAVKQQIRGEYAWDRLLQRNIQSSTNVSTEEVEAIVKQMNESKGLDEFHLGEIYLSATPENMAQVAENAQKIVQALQAGGSFAAYARQFSEASTAVVGGDLGWVRAGQLPASMAEQPSAGVGTVLREDAVRDLAEIDSLQHRYGIAADHLFVMPEGTASGVLRERSRWLAEEALERGWRFTDRLHIHLYGDTRGT